MARNKISNLKDVLRAEILSIMHFSILDFVGEIIDCAQRIEGRVVNLADDMLNKGELEQAQYYFMRFFLGLDIEYGRSTVSLANKGFSHAGIVVGRTMLESMLYFKTYMWYPSLAEIWLLYTMYEFHRKVIDDKGEDAANKILEDANELRGYDMQKKRLEKAQDEFNFKKRGLNFYDAKSIKNIKGIKKILACKKNKQSKH